MSIGSRITEWRKARGLTQAKLGELAKLSASTIAMYETNRRSPDQTAITKLADALKIPSALLTGGQSGGVDPARADTLAHATVAEAGPAMEPSVVGAAKVGVAVEPAVVGAAKAVAAVEPAVTGPAMAAPQKDTQSTQASQRTTTTQLALTHEEAKIILFLRMNPSSMSFFESYIRSDARQRDQLSRTWRLIHDFQNSPS